METFIIIAFVVLVIVYVEIFMHKRLLTQKEISDYQRTLDEVNASAKANFGLELNYEAKAKILENRRLAKSFVLFFSGFLVVLTLILSMLAKEYVSITNIGIMCISAIMLMSYGLIKMSESKKLAIGLLLLIFALGTLGEFVFDKLTMFPGAYFYLSGLVVILAIFSLTTKIKQV